MKKLIVTLIVLAILSVMMVPAMATENAAVKDYASAADGDLLYTVDFTGKDGVISFGGLGETASSEYFSYTPSEDGTSLTVKGAQESGSKGCLWGGVIDELKADSSTVYTMTFKVTVHGEAGLNNSVGVGGYYVGGWSSDSYVNALNFYGNWNTSEAGATYMRRGVLQVNNAKYNDAAYTMYDTLPDSYEVDENGYITAMLIFDGPAMTFSAYLRTASAGDGSAASDWVKVASDIFVPTQDCMGFVLYSYYIKTVHATIKDVNIYKGKIFSEPVVPETQPSTEAPTTVPTTEPTQESTKAPAASEPADNNAQEPSSPIGLIIGIAVAVVVVAAVVVAILKKKKNA